jgi:chaperonin GroES
MTKVQIQPLGNRVLIKRSKAQTTKGGILLPETAKEKPKEGTVIAAGPGKLNDEGKLEPTNLKIGDMVLFSSYSGTEVKPQADDDNEYLILSEDDILGIIK